MLIPPHPHPFILLSSFDLCCSLEELKMGTGFDSPLSWRCFPTGSHLQALWFSLAGGWWMLPLWLHEILHGARWWNVIFTAVKVFLSYYTCHNPVIAPRSRSGKRSLSASSRVDIVVFVWEQSEVKHGRRLLDKKWKQAHMLRDGFAHIHLQMQPLMASS